MYWLGRVGLLLLVVGGIGVLVVYIMAYVALHDLPSGMSPSWPILQETATTRDGHTISIIDATGASRVVSTEGDASVRVGGHKGPVAQSEVMAGSNEVVTLGADGSLRVTDVSRLVSLTQLSWLWPINTDLTTAAQPLAHVALRMASQVVPLELPKHAVGRRGRAFRDCRDGFCGPVMIELSPGSFLMGAPLLDSTYRREQAPRRLLTLKQPFAFGKTSVTVDEWAACVADQGCAVASVDPAGGRVPITNVSWHDAQAYAQWLSAKTGESYRLPTEVEREFATRAGTTTPFYWGASQQPGRTQCEGCGSAWEGKGPAPAASFSPNEFGLYDLHGNVWEWTQDCYDKVFTSEGGCSRSLRGGSWRTPVAATSAASRQNATPETRRDDIGFRLVRNL